MQNRHLYLFIKAWFVVIGLFASMHLFAQQPEKTNTAVADTSGINAIINYDEFFSLMDHFFDSLYTPRSFAVIGTGITSNYYNYTSAHNKIKTLEKLVLNPSIAYYYKNGLGISAAASIITGSTEFIPYQYAVTGSYDYIKNRKLATGISFTHFFTKDSLPFYTSPLQNKVGAYFTYRKWWVKPMVTANYGWGNRSSYMEVTQFFKHYKPKGQRGKPFKNVIGTSSSTIQEAVNDLTIAASAKHDFYWLNVVSKKDFFRLTPQLMFTGGTQKFGFNQSSSSSLTLSETGVNLLTTSKNVNLDNSDNFRLLAVTAFLKSEFSIGKFFVQPQVIVDYYVPTASDNISTTYAINTGFIF